VKLWFGVEPEPLPSSSVTALPPVARPTLQFTVVEARS
jgi:hypothetical protein